jgi:hypothetical protein
MASSAGRLRKELAGLLEGRPGWRLEPRTTPGATPLWCFVSEGEVEFSVTVEGPRIRLYVMATDEDREFDDADELEAWVRDHRADALRERPPRPAGKNRIRRFIDWG